MLMCVLVVFFFFKQKTAYEMRISDWSSDVCSSDLPVHASEADQSKYRIAKEALQEHENRLASIVTPPAPTSLSRPVELRFYSGFRPAAKCIELRLQLDTQLRFQRRFRRSQWAQHMRCIDANQIHNRFKRPRLRFRSEEPTYE